jgi:hypothetical protein
MTRVRWIEAKWPFSMRTLSSRLKSKEFTAESSDGFILHRTRDTFIDGKYAEKVFVDEVVRDPFGNEHVINRVVFKQVEFTFSADFPQIELRDFPRGLQSFTSRLSEATNFTAAFAPIKVDVISWASAIRERLGSSVIVDGANVSEFQVEEGVIAKMRLSSSSHDVLGPLARFTKGKRHLTEDLRIRTGREGAKAFHLSGDATLRVLNDVSLDSVSLIREAISRALLP